MKRSAITLFVLLGILVLASIYYRQQTPEHLAPTKVIALPADYDPDTVYAPYSGPHPSETTRPDETFMFPIRPGETGPVQPLFAGPLQYPFLCRTEQAGLGQPLVDNQEGAGIKVFKVDDNGNKTAEIIGYSKDCMIATRVVYMYKRRNDTGFYPVEQADNDIETITIDGETVDFIVRVEIGSMHRHPYAIYILKGQHDTPLKPDVDRWNKKLIIQFRGGVGIGKQQGVLDLDNLLQRRTQQLAQGYAVVYSTANQTSNTYNTWLSEDTALRLKRQFTALYGWPDYTVGIGGSGGAIQQYLLAQNNPDLLDAIIPLYSYPDMITTTTYILDCELLEYFFDVTDSVNPKWRNHDNRQWLEGMNSDDDTRHKYGFLIGIARLLQFQWPNFSSGISECTKSWRGLTPLILNPHFPPLPERLAPEVQAQANLTYWDDLKFFFGTDDKGNPRITWDNVGVQYGLDALKAGNITVETFIKLNKTIGGWKKPEQMQPEHYWFITHEWWPDKFSPWSHHNMNLSTGNKPAPRTRGDVAAIQAAWRSGQVFTGKINLPVIDLRHYLDHELDMHHSFSSFSARSRIRRELGHADNQIIWQTKKPHTLVPEVFDLIDRWLHNIEQYPEKTVGANKPHDATDACYDEQGRLIASGDDVWNGAWNNKPDGACTRIYPPFKSSRMVAGDSIAGDIIKCRLQPVAQAIDAGLYDPVDIRPWQAQLELVFPQGVCDYSRPGIGRPPDI